MKYVKQFCLFTILFLLNTVSLTSQNSVVASGLEASGSGGQISSSIGQITYQNFEASNGSLSEGLQQAYETFIISSTSELLNDLQVRMYPNPTTDRIILQIDNQDLKDLQYQLMDAQGRLLEIQDLQSSHTEINFQKKAIGHYFIQLSSESLPLKTFKIIKNH